MIKNKLKVFAFVVLLTFLSSTLVFAATPKVVQMTFYEKVKLGMTKATVDKALNVKPTKITEDFTRPNTYKYYNKKGDYGVQITYSKAMKVECKNLVFGGDRTRLSVYCENYVSKDLAMQTYKGMSLEEVIQLFGSTGVETGNEANEQLMREWYNEDGSNVTAYYNSTEGIYNISYCNVDGSQDSDVATIFENN